jgi:hypothetical protein
MKLATHFGFAISLALFVLLPVSCASVEGDGPPPVRDRAAFDAQVWPILVRDCGFSECHGSSERFFRVVGPGHERLDPAMRLTEPVTEAELQFSFDRARSMVDMNDPRQSPLLRKPLEVSAGGSAHEGTDSYGMDVYRRVDDPAFLALVNWVVNVAQVTGGNGP